LDEKQKLQRKEDWTYNKRVKDERKTKENYEKINKKKC